MTDSTQDLLARVLALPEADRRVIADALDASLMDESADAIFDDPEYRAELDRRLEEVANHPENLLDAEAVLAGLLARAQGVPGK